MKPLTVVLSAPLGGAVLTAEVPSERPSWPELVVRFRLVEGRSVSEAVYGRPGR